MLVWALLGNDEDGDCGERSGKEGWDPRLGPVTLTCWAWWRRNPFHNLTFHVINWPWAGRVGLLLNTPWFYIGWRPDVFGSFGMANHRYGEQQVTFKEDK